MYYKFYTKQFLKSFHRLCRSGTIGRVEVEDVVDMLASGTQLHATYRDHALRGDMRGYRECHIRGDVLLVYTIEKQKLVLILIDIGSHSSLFE